MFDAAASFLLLLFAFIFCQEPSKQYLGDAQPFPLNRLSDEKPKFVDASQLFRKPLRTSRPDHFVIILRGLPGALFIAVLLIAIDGPESCCW